jgi:hypothetical protein
MLPIDCWLPWFKDKDGNLLGFRQVRLDTLILKTITKMYGLFLIKRVRKVIFLIPQTRKLKRIGSH